MTAHTERTTRLANQLEELYENYADTLLFHGWHHIYLVARKAVEFADELKVDKEIVEAAALTHDLNYIVDRHTTGPEAGADLRAKHLHQAGFNNDEIASINAIILEEHTAYRHANISDAAKILSDADSLFKYMPLTPVLFASKFISESQGDLRAWATRITKEQKPLQEQGILFYTKRAKKKYLAWAETNLQLVEQVLESLDDPDIQEMLAIARRHRVI